MVRVQKVGHAGTFGAGQPSGNKGIAFLNGLGGKVCRKSRPNHLLAEGLTPVDEVFLFLWQVKIV